MAQFDLTYLPEELLLKPPKAEKYPTLDVELDIGSVSQEQITQRLIERGWRRLYHVVHEGMFVADTFTNVDTRYSLRIYYLYPQETFLIQDPDAAEVGSAG